MKWYRNIHRNVLCVFIGCAIAVSSLVYTTSAYAEGLLEQAKANGLRVGFNNYRPFAFVDENGDVTGESIEVLKAVVKKLGIDKIETSSTEWAALIPGLNANRFDVVASGMFITPDRCNAVLFTEPTFGIKQTLVVLKGNPKGITNYESIRDKNLKIVVQTGSAHLDYAKSAGIPEANILQLPDLPTVHAALKSGRADAFAEHNVGAKANLVGDAATSFESIPPFTVIAGKSVVSHGAYAFRKSDADFVADLDKIIKTFVGSDEHLQLITHYNFGKDEMPTASKEELCGSN
jgi:polar amino acid transport system substrate-binding protein